MKKIIKKLFTPFAVFAMALGIGVSLSAPKEVLKTSAATHTVTITRSNFPSGALAYGTDDKWTATGTDGTALEGYFDLYATANQDNMQTRTKTPIGNYFHNTVAFPGPITKIELTGANTGYSRQWTPFTLIKDRSGIHFGATYALGSPDNDVAMKAEHSNFFSSYTATYVGGNLVEEAITQLFTIEIGAVQNTFALKLTNGPKVGEYISYSGSSNALYTSDTLNNNSSWTIVFETDGSAVITNVAVNDRKIQYNSDSPRFAAYKSTTLLAPIKLFVADSTIDATVSADRLATEINDGRGNSAQGSCEELLGVFNGALNQLSTDAKSIFNTSTDAKYVNARARLAYLNSWVAAQPGSNPTRQSTSDQSKNNLVAVISIGAIGLTSILGYYFVSKKKKLS